MRVLPTYQVVDGKENGNWNRRLQWNLAWFAHATDIALTDYRTTRTMKFESILKHSVPKGREGKHREIVSQLLSDLGQLPDGSALKIPLAELPDSKENIRAALSRATKQRGLEVATSSDAEHLYVWKVEPDEVK